MVSGRSITDKNAFRKNCVESGHKGDFLALDVYEIDLSLSSQFEESERYTWLRS